MIAQCDARVHEHVHPPCLVFCADNRGVTVRGLTVYLLVAGPPASGATRAGGDRAPRSRRHPHRRSAPRRPARAPARARATGAACSGIPAAKGMIHEKLAIFHYFLIKPRRTPTAGAGRGSQLSGPRRARAGPPAPEAGAASFDI